MTSYQFHDDSEVEIDARFEIQPGELILLSRGGPRGSPNARNTAYKKDLLRMILERIRRSELTLIGVWADSKHVESLPLEERQIFFPEDQEASPEDLSRKLQKRMASVGQALGTRGGNSTKRLRFAFAGNPSDKRIARIVGWGDKQ